MGLCNSIENSNIEPLMAYFDQKNGDDENNNSTSNLIHSNNEENTDFSSNMQNDIQNNIEISSNINDQNKKNYASIDILKNEQDRIEIKKDSDKTEKYYFDLSHFSYNYYNYYKERKKKIEAQTKESLTQPEKQAIRSKIRVLIIIGSYPDFKLLDDDANYFEDAEDFTTAFLICHLFHYAFLIPYAQILITTTKENGFIDEKSKMRYQDMDEKTKMSKINDLSFKFWQKEFGFYQNVNIAQVGKKQYKFYLENELLQRIKPFDHNIIKNEINPDDKSDLFVFFLDHNNLDLLNGECEYKNIIDELIQIPCDHYYMMNDSCYSGSLIEIINASYDFEKIIKAKLDSESEYSLFKLLFTYGNFNSEEELVQSLNNMIRMIEENDKFNKEFIVILRNLEIKNLVKFRNKILTIFPYGVESFTPQNFTRFGDKSTIFSSSDYQNISLTLPARRISVFLHDNFRICGSVFSSIFIESLLIQNSSLESFCFSLKNLFEKYKVDFEQIIIYQNQSNNSNENGLNRKLISKDAIMSFFNIKNFDRNHFFSHSNKWPDLQLILINDENCWNVDCTDVNINEYKDVFFFDLKKETVIIKNLNNYGPKRGMSSIEKFSIDYENEVKKILEKKGYTKIQFNTCQPSKKDLEGKYKNMKFENWSKFFMSIRSYYSSKIGLGLMALRYPVSIFFYNNPDFNLEIGLKIFLEAFENIYPFWKDHSLYF